MRVTSSSTMIQKQMPLKPRVKEIKLLDGSADAFGGITVDIKEQMDLKVFAHALRASLSQWKQQGKKGIWIKLPIELADLVAVTVQIETKFLKILSLRQSPKSFFGKSDLFFVCMLRPRSFDIQKQVSEIQDAKWMALEEYAAQPFNKKPGQFKYIVDICLEKNKNSNTGFSAVTATSGQGFSSKKSSLYFNHKDLKP